jgi:hypothetical protein
MISAHQLYQVVEQKTSDDRSILLSELFLDAMNDWPTLNLKEPDEFIGILKNEVGPCLTLSDFKLFSRRLHLTQDAWKIESMASLFKIFDVMGNENSSQQELEKILDSIIVIDNQSFR